MIVEAVAHVFAESGGGYKSQFPSAGLSALSVTVHMLGEFVYTPP